MKRIESLDWLRGLMAVSIMVYHCSNWNLGFHDASTVIGRLGIYGVSSFYILSGLSLSIIYNRKVDTFKNIKNFFIKRIFRILPLMWVATALVLVQIYFIDKSTIFPSISTIFLNFTTLFGFIRPDDYMATGSWSIGNEMVFYTLFPIFIFIFNKSKTAGNILFFATLAVEVLFAFYLLTPSAEIQAQWKLYVNPFNQLFLFGTGIFLFYNFRNTEIKNWLCITIFIAAIVLFVLYPSSGNQINIVTGYNRFIYSFLFMFIVLAFWKMNIKLPFVLEKSLNAIGIATYSVYLLHPFVNLGAGFIFKKIGFGLGVPQIILTCIITILLSVVVYKIYEEPFMKLGKKVTS
jgi:peptidoglycan/LPS O-acetylase OafA/YrhL